MVASLGDRDPLSVATATYGRGRRVTSNQRQVVAIDLIATSPSNAGVDPVIFLKDVILLLAINHQPLTRAAFAP